jgi:hypothetical protein
MTEAKSSQRQKPGPEHKHLEPAVGKWNTRGKTIATASEPAVEFSGTDIYAWIGRGFFLLHSVDVMMGDQPVIGVEIIRYDPSSRTYQASFVDSRGNTSTSEVRYDKRKWTVIGEAERFAGTFSEDWNTLSGRWERKNGSRWEPWMDVTLTRAA